MPLRVWFLVLFAVAFAVAGIAPHDRGDWLLEHSPTVALLALLVWYEKRPGGRPLSDVSYALLTAFLLLHVLGAHYLYTRVPYDEWSRALFGTSVSEAFDLRRNHYDRLVHLAFGVLVMPPLAELVHRHVARGRTWTIVVAIAFVGVLSKLYELAEWLIALTMSPEAAENYNGQQGDMFDAHKDMALALLGSLAVTPFAARWLRRLPPGGTAE